MYWKLLRIYKQKITELCIICKSDSFLLTLETEKWCNRAKYLLPNVQSLMYIRIQLQINWLS